MLKQKFLIDFASKFSIRIITAACGIVVARLAGPEVVGTIAYAMAYVSLFMFITKLFGPAHIKLVSEGQNEADCNKTFSLIFIVSSTIYLLVVLCTFFFQRFTLNYHFKGDHTDSVILIILSSVLISKLYEYSQITFVARLELANANLPSFIMSLLYNFLRIVVVLFGYGAIALAGINLLSAIIISPLAICLLRKLDFGKSNFRLFKKYVSIALPLLMFTIVSTLITHLDKLILGYYSTTREIGIYTAAFSIGGMLILLGNAAGTVFFPLFSSLISKNDLSEVRRKINQFERFVFVFILPLIIGLSLFSSPVMVTLLGSQYEQSGPILGLLVFSSFFLIWGMPYGNVLTGMGLFWLTSFIRLAILFIFIATLIFCLHPNFLDMGAMALAVTQVVMNILLFFAFYFFAYRKIGVQFIKEQAKYILFWCIIYVFTVFFIFPLVDSYTVHFQSLVVMPLFVLLLFVVQKCVGLLNNQDLHMLWQLINSKKIFQYVNSELRSNSHNNPSSRL